MPSTAPAQALANLTSWARAQEIAIGKAQYEQLGIYLENLLLWNRRVALVSQCDAATIVDKHFADALIAARQCEGAASVVDLGSGAGFPGIVVAIQCPSTNVTLIESRRKKASFLSDTVRALRLANVRVIPDRIESVALQPDHAGHYSISIARALGSLATLLEYSGTLLSKHGRVLAMKGPSYAREIEGLPIDALGFQPPSIELYSLPDRSARALISFARA